MILHDWSGDPLENLRLVYELLLYSRKTVRRPPLLMMEDLEGHPYPIDIHFFEPLARTRMPYGHREAVSLTPGYPGKLELGPSLFSGALVLGFEEQWWRGLDEASFKGAFDFLLFNEFDEDRLNILKPGPPPLASPPLLDWWTGYGVRCIDGANARDNPEIKARLIRSAITVEKRLSDILRARWSCRMAMYKSLIELEALGADRQALTSRTGLAYATPRAFPSVEMAAMYQQALNNEGLRAQDEVRLSRIARWLLPAVRNEAYADAAFDCLNKPGDAASTAHDWSRVYRTCREQVERAPQ